MKQMYKYLVSLLVFLMGYLVTSGSIELYRAHVAESKTFFKDTAEIESEVCVKGNHVIVFTVLKKFDENIQIYVDQAGYKETFSIVVGKCTENTNVRP